MKNSNIVILVAVLLFIGVFAFMQSGKKSEEEVVDNTPTIPQETASIKGCYVARIQDRDVYTLNIQNQQGANVSGVLAFKNFEKDSSSGTFNGTYSNDVLLADYTFQSEGSTSVMEVIFKKSGENFVRGYGPVTNEGTRFSDISAVTYDESSPLALFKKEACQ